MERLNDILKSLIGILLLISFVAAFSSCNNDVREEADEEEKDSDTVLVVKKNPDWKEDLQKESRELEARLDTLGNKVKQKGGELSKEVQTRLDDLDNERKDIFNDSTDEKIETRWKEFKARANKELDSLDQKW